MNMSSVFSTLPLMVSLYNNSLFNKSKQVNRPLVHINVNYLVHDKQNKLKLCGRITYIVSNTEVYDSVMADVMKKIATQKKRKHTQKHFYHYAIHICTHIKQIQQLLRNVKCLRPQLVIFIWLYSLHTF